MKIGIIGAGQLAKLLIEESNKFQTREGLPLHEFRLYDEKESCASDLGEFFQGSFSELGESETSNNFIKDLDLITYEFENIPAKNLSLLDRKTFVHPTVKALEISQSRVKEKEYFKSLGLPVAEVHFVNAKTINTIKDLVKGEYLLKTDRLGYDGKGQIKVSSGDELLKAFTELGEVDCVLEKLIEFEKEISVSASRNESGDIAIQPISKNLHSKGILIEAGPTGDHIEAQNIIRKVLEDLNYIGSLCIELFVTDKGLYINEMAPRVHNSFHWTIEGVVGNQFINHILAITNENLLSTKLINDCYMFNVIGKHASVGVESQVSYHNYGKSERKGRKIGHITINDPEKNKEIIKQIRSQLAVSNDL